jgi:CheY-like chemotaxis protein
VRELEQLCVDVLGAAVDLGLPQPILNRLWAAVGDGELPHAFLVDLRNEQRAAAGTDPAAPSTEPGSSPDAPPTPVAEPLPIPDLPLSSAVMGATSTSHPPQPELRPIADTKTVVIVDDDPMMLDVLNRILQRENLELHLATSGPEALKAVERLQDRVDLLVTDYAMPDMQGRQLADLVRQRCPAVKVLYQTGFSDMLFESRAELEEGAAFLEKPFTARGLREAVRLALFGTLNPS